MSVRVCHLAGVALLGLLLVASEDAAGSEECKVRASLLLQAAQARRKLQARVEGAPPPSVLSWDGPTLSGVQEVLMQPDTAPAWALAAQSRLLRDADRVKELPAGLRTGVPAGPWSPTQKALTPPSGDKRDYMTISGYAWPCTTQCSGTGYSEEKCKLWEGGLRTFGPCNTSTGKPWVMRDGFLNYNNLQDLKTMVVAMDTLETLTLAWWFAPLSPDRSSYAEAAMRVFRAYFLNETTRMNPRLLFGGSVPGKYENGTAGAIIAPTFRMNSRFVDCATLLQLVDPPVWTAEDEDLWKKWAQDWSTWLHTSTFGKIELGAVGNHATFSYIHQLALDKVTSDDDHAKELIGKLRTEFAGSLAEQIKPSGEMPVETARVTGAIYSLMNLQGLFLLGTVIENLCQHLDCNPDWDWSWKAPAPTATKWEKHANKISYCRYVGRSNTATSVDECKSACTQNSRCNGVVTRVRRGTWAGCYFKQCAGAIYQLRDAPTGFNVYDSYHRVQPPAEGSGSIQGALDYLRPFALGEKRWTDSHRGVDADNEASRWRPLARVMSRAAVVFGEPVYKADIAQLDSDFDSLRDNLLFPRP